MDSPSKPLLPDDPLGSESSHATNHRAQEETIYVTLPRWAEEGFLWLIEPAT